MAPHQLPRPNSVQASRCALSAALLAGLFCMACDDPEDPQADAFADSLATWEQLRDANDDTYSYARSQAIGSAAGETDCVVTTSLEIEGGVVVARSLSAQEAEGSCPEAWSEAGEELGSHTGSGVAPVLTIDEIYARCEDEVIGTPYPWDEQPEDVEAFTTNEEGLIAHCGWYRWDSTHDRVEGTPYFEVSAITFGG